MQESKPSFNQPEKNTIKKEAISLEQIKNIQEVFKLNPELKTIVCNSLGIENDKDIVIEINTDESGYPEPEGLFHKFKITHKGEVIIDDENEGDYGHLSIRTKKDGKNSYINIIELPTRLQNQGLGIKILQKIANTLDTKIVPAFLGDGDVTSEQARNMWKKVNNEILPNYKAEKSYAEYLKTIFPESMVKDVVFHGTKHDFEEFDNHDYSFFTKDISLASHVANYSSSGKHEARIIPAILNVKKVWHYEKEGNGMEMANFHFDRFIKQGYDTFINSREIAVTKPEQIHILGSKKDIEQLKIWLENQKEVKK